MKLLRILGYAAGVVAGLVLLLGVGIYIQSERVLRKAPAPRPSHLAAASPEQLVDGGRQLRVLGCVGCHGEKLQGDLFLDLPGIARLYAPNLALLAARATDAQLDQAIRQGIGHDGRPLLVMPSEGYQFLSDSETAALIAAIRTLPKGGVEQPAVWVGPRGRVGLALGKLQPAPALVAQYRANPLPDLGRNLATGRHIVEVNCSECHGPDLRGKELKPGTVSADLTIAGAYDLEQFRTMLRTGVGAGGKNIGMMGEVARSDFSHLTDDEISAVHAYLVERAQRSQ